MADFHAPTWPEWVAQAAPAELEAERLRLLRQAEVNEKVAAEQRRRAAQLDLEVLFRG